MHSPVLYFNLHHLPEHFAGRTKKAQLEIVAVLAILAMFTHEHIFWIAALLLALVELPDFSTPINSMAQSLQRLAQPFKAPQHGRGQAQSAPVPGIRPDRVGNEPIDVRPAIELRRGAAESAKSSDRRGPRVAK